MSTLIIQNNSSLKWIIAIFAIGFVYSLSAIFEPQFINHTEADRALIGLEMLRSGNFVVPHLLGDPYLTKPPLFYWAVALSYSIFPSLEPWVPRLPSAICCGILLSIHFAFLRRAGWNLKLSLGSVAVLASTPAIYLYSTNAEIDFVFTTICALSLYAAYFTGPPSLSLSSIYWSILTGILCGLAVLTKGPQPLLLYCCAISTLALTNRTVCASPRDFWRIFLIKRTIEGAIIALVVLPWVYLIVSQVGFNELSYHLNTEIISRVAVGNHFLHRLRSPLFYLGTILGAMLPWSLLLFGIWKARSLSFKESEENSSYNKVYYYALGIAVPSLVIFSLFPAKASRYVMPLYPWLSSILTIILLRFELSPWSERFKKFWGVIFGLGVVATLALPILLYNKIAMIYLILGVVSCLTIFSIATYSSFSKIGIRSYIAWIAIIFMTSRVPFRYLYAEERNATKSVISSVEEINSLVPSGEPIYILEMFERWVPYYLIDKNRQVFRLTPRITEELKTQSLHPIYIILNKEEEEWRAHQLAKVGTSLEIIKELPMGKKGLLLVSVPSSKAYQFAPKAIFPTVKSEPYPGILD